MKSRFPTGSQPKWWDETWEKMAEMILTWLRGFPTFRGVEFDNNTALEVVAYELTCRIRIVLHGIED